MSSKIARRMNYLYLIFAGIVLNLLFQNCTASGIGSSAGSSTPAASSSAAPTCVGTQYFVSPTGSDSNNGTSASTPWQTITHVNAGSSYSGGGLSAGQCVAFQAGQSFTGCLVFSTSTNITSSSASNPIIVGSYGSGAATINSNAACAGLNNGAQGPRKPLVLIDGSGAALTGFNLQNLTLSANGTATQYGVLIQSSGGGTSSNITLQNLTVTGFNTTASGDSSAEIQVLGYPLTGSVGALNAISVLNSTLMGASGVGSPDDQGISGYGYGENITNAIYSGNTIYNIGGRAGIGETGAGIVIGGVLGATVSHNLIHDIGGNANSCGGMSGIESYDSGTVTVSYNEIYKVQPTAFTAGCDWDGIDLDGGTTNSVVEYNYTHNNYGLGLYGWMGSANAGQWGPNTYRYNISENDHISMGFSNTGAPNPIVYIYNNSLYHSNSAPSGSTGIAFALFGGQAGTYGGGPSVAAGSFFENNIIMEASGNALTGCNGSDLSVMLFKNNVYYSPGGTLQLSAPGNNSYYCKNTSGAYEGPFATLAAWQAYANGGDANAQNVNPQFAGALPAGTCSWTPSSQAGSIGCPLPYKLSAGSSLIGSGRSVLAQGSLDFFGNAISNGVGSGINVGADGGNP